MLQNRWKESERLLQKHVFSEQDPPFIKEKKKKDSRLQVKGELNGREHISLNKRGILILSDPYFSRKKKKGE